MNATTHPFLPFIPMAWRQALTHGRRLPPATTGAALFADISGFTPLTTALVDHLGSQRGPEELTQTLNQIYTLLIDEVHRYHGTVIGFSGDAILCWFATDDTVTLAQTCHLATTCAWHMQTAMQDNQPTTPLPQMTEPLAIKIAITAGTAQRLLVGNPQDQQIPLMAGAVIDRTAHAEKCLARGEIALGAEILSHFGPQISLKEWRQSTTGEYFAIAQHLNQFAPQHPWPPLEVPHEDTFDAWVLPPVAARLRHGPFMAQLRTCIPLFLKFTGIDFDKDAQASQKLDAYIRWVQAILARYEGHLIQLTLGDKGSYLYACFGALVSHEDIATRAVATAVALHTPPANLNFITAQIGISQGQMVAGTYGSPEQLTFGVLGNQVNIAARLMNQAQSGQTLITNRVTQAVTTYAFAELPPLTLKGIDQPVPISLLTTSTTMSPPLPLTAPTTTPLVGREHELNRLLQTLTDLQQGKSQIVIIEGEAGIGKSQLLNHWRERALTHACHPIWGAADALETTTPYYVWRQIFPQLLASALDAPNLAAQQTAVRDSLTAVWDPTDPDLDHLPLLTAVLPIPWPDNEHTQHLQGDGRAHKTQQLLTHLLQTEAQQRPLFLIIEDAHWLDASSWDLIRHLVVDVHPLLLAIVTRPLFQPWPPAYNYLQNHPSRLEITLNKLTHSEIEQILATQLGVANFPPAITKLIHERAEGHPFFSEQLIHGLLDAGIITIHDNQCNLVPGLNWHTITLPQTVQEVIASRIDRLSISEQLTLKVASVIGRAFAPEILREMHPIEKEKPHLEAHLHQLTQKELIFALTHQEKQYIFKHIITQEVAYNSLLFAQRQALHGAVAHWYETVYPDLTPHFPLLAYHWQRAENSAKAIHYWAQAGQHAITTGANQEAVHFWEQLLTLIPNLTPPATAHQQASWHYQLGVAYHNVGRLTDSETHLTTALTWLQQPLPPPSNNLWHIAWPALKILLRYGRGITPTERKTRPATDEEQLLLKIYHYLMILTYLNNTNLNQGTHIIDQMNHIALTAGAWGPLAQSYAGAAIGLTNRGHHRLARRFSHTATDLIPYIANPEQQSRVQLILGVYAIETGSLATAQQLMATAAETAQNSGNIHFWLEAMSFVSPILTLQGDYASAQAVAAQVYQLAVRHDDPFLQGLQRKHEALVAWRQGLAEEAFLLAQEAVNLMPANASAHNQLMVLAPLLLIQVGTKRMAMAAHTVPQVIALRQQTTFYSFNLYETPISLVEYAFANWTDDINEDQRGEVEQACTRLRQVARTSWPSRPWAALSMGRLLWRLDRQAQALRWFTQAITAATELAMPYEAAWAHYHLGRHLVGTDPNGRSHLKEAYDIFERLGATRALGQVNQIL